MPDLKVKYAILCDDVRRETNGKEILIGVYNDVIVVGSLPAALEKIFVRLTFSCPRDYKGMHTLKIVQPNKKDLFSLPVDLPPADANADRILGVAIRGIQFDEPGEYQIRFGKGDRPKKVWSFIVRLPEDEIEKGRLANS